MSVLLHGDCLDLMKELDDNSVDLIFCDLPYGQTSCKWDCCIDLEKFWKEVMRIKKLNTPIFFTTTTKFGVSLIQSAPKKCFFRYDLVWVKSAPAGFLSAKKMPMRKHEMVYVFYEKLPFYDLSSHKHKFIKERDAGQKNGAVYGGEEGKKLMEGAYEPKLPVSVVKEPQMIKEGQIYNGGNAMPCSDMRDGEGGTHYEPPLPVSVMKEETGGATGHETIYGKVEIENPKARKGGESRWNPPLPVSVVKEGEINNDNIYRGGKGKPLKDVGVASFGATGPCYEPPLPVSVVKERQNTTLYGEGKDARGVKYTEDYRDKHGKKEYDPPLPVSVVKEDIHFASESYNTIYNNKNKNATPITPHPKKKGDTGVPRYEPPLPTTMLEIKSTRGKHSTEKPVALMEWILKYYSKEGDTILDPTMGSGSTGVACKNMNRNFIGIEMDAEIYEVAVNRIEE